MLQEQREQLTRQHHNTARAAQQAREELEGTPRWARTRRRDLTTVLSQVDEQRQQQPLQLAHLDAEISQVTDRLEAHDRDWNTRRDTDLYTSARRAATAPDPLGKLTSPSRPTTSPTTKPSPRTAGRPTGWPTRRALDPQTGVSRSVGPGQYRPSAPGPGRDGGRSR